MSLNGQDHPRFIDIMGHKFGLLTVTGFAGMLVGRGKTKQGYAHWHCKCDCGNASVVGGNQLRSGWTMSCGCLRKRAPGNMSHGLCKTPEYPIWQGIKLRCYNPNRDNFKYYGGRGITMCDAWKGDFGAFYRDMGPRPTSKHTVERLDVNGPYSPDNCIWLEARFQTANRRPFARKSQVTA